MAKPRFVLLNYCKLFKFFVKNFIKKVVIRIIFIGLTVKYSEDGTKKKKITLKVLKMLEKVKER